MLQIECPACERCSRPRSTRKKLVQLRNGTIWCTECAEMPYLQIASVDDYCSSCGAIIKRGEEVGWAATKGPWCLRCARVRDSSLTPLTDADRQELQEVIDRVQCLEALPTPHSQSVEEELNRHKRRLKTKFGRVYSVMRLLERYGQSQSTGAPADQPGEPEFPSENPREPADDSYVNAFFEHPGEASAPSAKPGSTAKGSPELEDRQPAMNAESASESKSDRNRHLYPVPGNSETDHVARQSNKKLGKYVTKIREKSPQAYYRWSLEEEQQLRCLLDRKAPIIEIAKWHGRSRGAINSRIRKMLEENKAKESSAQDMPCLMMPR